MTSQDRRKKRGERFQSKKNPVRSFDVQKYRSCESKKSYASERMAQDACEVRETETVRPWRYYQCKNCKEWHVSCLKTQAELRAMKSRGVISDE